MVVAKMTSIVHCSLLLKLLRCFICWTFHAFISFFILSMATAMFFFLSRMLKSLPGLHAPMFRIRQGARCCRSVSFFFSSSCDLIF